ncbi:hypothetical protein [Halobacillus litoralis]|uniref:hypothetical protein n=1 Tax=Halobacillus litoralis TaxID=45668 RepID=UPI001CFF3E15|nr:hypothetical protein [Halobacillus litoralis]
MKQWIQSYSLGLITATACLAITYWNTESQEAVNVPTPLTEEEMISKVEEKGYRIVTNEEWAALNAEGKIEEEPASPVSRPITLSMDISPGTTTPEISRKLLETNIIEDAESFESYMEDHEYSRYIQIGQATLTSDMSFKQIAEAITSK